MAHDITEKFKTAQDAAKRYLLEELEIEDILPYVKDWRNMSFYDYDRESRIYSCLESGLKTLHRRALILECLRKYDSYFRRYWLCPKPDDGKSENGYRMLIDPRQIRAILELLEEERVPAQYQLDFLGSEYANFYDYNGQGVYKSDDAMQRCVESRIHGSGKRKSGRYTDTGDPGYGRTGGRIQRSAAVLFFGQCKAGAGASAGDLYGASGLGG